MIFTRPSLGVALAPHELNEKTPRPYVRILSSLLRLLGVVAVQMISQGSIVPRAFALHCDPSCDLARLYPYR